MSVKLRVEVFQLIIFIYTDSVSVVFDYFAWTCERVTVTFSNGRALPVTWVVAALTEFFWFAIVNIEKATPFVLPPCWFLCERVVNFIVPPCGLQKRQSESTDIWPFLVGCDHVLISNYFPLPMWCNQSSILILEKHALFVIASEMFFYFRIDQSRIKVIISIFLLDQRISIRIKLVHESRKSKNMSHFMDLK